MHLGNFKKHWIVFIKFLAKKYLGQLHVIAVGSVVWIYSEKSCSEEYRKI